MSNVHIKSIARTLHPLENFKFCIVDRKHFLTLV